MAATEKALDGMPSRSGWASMSFGWTIYVVPFMFVFSDSLLMNGPPWEIAIDFAAAIAGIWFVSAAIMGYSFRRLELTTRLLYGLTGACVMVPLAAFVAAPWLKALGAALAIAILWRERIRRGKLAARMA